MTPLAPARPLRRVLACAPCSTTCCDALFVPLLTCQAQDEKKEYPSEHTHADNDVPPKKLEENEEEDEDIDALIEELESQDAGIDAEEEEVTQPGGARPVAEDLLQTDTRTGLTSAEVLSRRKKFGMNQMKGMSRRKSLCLTPLTACRGEGESDS